MDHLLLIIDMQEGFRHVASESILPNLQQLQQTFKGKIVCTQFVNERQSLFETQLRWTTFQSLADQQLLPELHTAADSVIIAHHTYTVLNEALKDFILYHGIVRVYLAGIYTDVCIIKTAMDLFDEGIEAFVIADACSSLHGHHHHAVAIDSLQHILGRHHVINTNDI